jgi:hypothetical protein
MINVFDHIKYNVPYLYIGDAVGNTSYIDFITQEQVTTPIVYGMDKFDRPFFVIRLVGETETGEKIHFMDTFFKRYTNNDSHLWISCGWHGKHIMYTEGGVSQKQINELYSLINGKVLDTVTDNTCSVTNIRLAKQDEWLV